MLPILCVYVLMAGGCKSSADTAAANNGILNTPGWPKTFENNGQTVTVFQPQVLAWTGQENLQFRAAVAVMENGAKQPAYGVMNGTAQTYNDLESRTAYLYDLQMDITFPGLDPNKSNQLATIVHNCLPSLEYTPASMDHIIASLKATEKRPTVEVNLNPPPIYYFESPAILVIYNGTPNFKPIEGTQLKYAVNTNWDVLQDTTTSKYYLLDGDSWFTAPDVMNGPWTPVTDLPADFSKLPTNGNWEDALKHIPGKTASSAPAVVASIQPAELIVTDGAVKLVDIPGTSLQYVSNPQTPLFYDKSNSTYYYLVAGRWFSTLNLYSNQWAAASAQLPSDFAKIPPGGPMGSVLASVPGTPQAQDAVVLASIPHEADINIEEAKVDVVYAGDPQFVAIEGTSMTYAINTSYQVIGLSGKYYCCYQGVWFVSSASMGPWAVCTSVPKEIYTIPPSCPDYNCTYVYVYSSTPSTVVVGYTGGYDGAYVAATGCLMFGAGMMVGAAFASPCCYPSYYSYGCCAHYSYAAGGYYRAGTCYGPYGGAGYAAKYNPSTGTYSRSGYAYGPGGAAGYRQAYNPYTKTYASRAGGTNGYSSWGSSTVAHNGNWASAGHVSGPGGTTGWAQTSGGKSAAWSKSANGDVYASGDGNVYRKNSDGQWQEHSNGSSGWSDVNKSDFSGDKANQLNSDAASRDRGSSNSDSFHNYRNSSGGGGWGDRGGGGFGGGGGFDRGGGFGGGGFGGGGFGGGRR
jgi:hypothetical protein